MSVQCGSRPSLSQGMSDITGVPAWLGFSFAAFVLSLGQLFMKFQLYAKDHSKTERAVNIPGQADNKHNK